MSVQTFALLESLKHIEIMDHQHADSLEVFILRWPAGDELNYATLDEALEAHAIEVVESSEAGQVSHIKIISHSEQMVFLMAGEQLVGCKQNRVLNASIMVPPHAEMPLPVTCVERGRWGYTSSAFSSARTSSYYGLRAMMHGHTTKSYHAAGVPISDQGEVWGEVSRKLHFMGSPSSSDAMQDLYRTHDAKLKNLEEKITVPAGCNGAVFVVDGRIVGSDLFDKPDTLRKLWPKLIRSCSIDALERSTETPRSLTEHEVLGWLEGGASASQEPFPSPGIGQNVRIEGEDVIGASLVIEEHPVHMELFRRTLPQQP